MPRIIHACLSAPLTFVTAMCLMAQPSVRITSPAYGTVVHPGDTVPVNVSTSGGTFLGMMIEVQSPIENQALLSRPYRFVIHIPADTTPGMYYLTASGTTTPGHGAESEAVAIDVERTDDPISISTEPLGSMDLNMGDRTALTVSGKYKDGSSLFLNKSTRIRFVSLAPSIVTVSNDGALQAVGIGSTEIVIHVGNKTIKRKVDVKKRD